MKPTAERVYRVYLDDGGNGPMTYLVAKNRKEAYKLAPHKISHVTYCPWLKWVDGKAVDQWGNIQENRR